MGLQPFSEKLITTIRIKAKSFDLYRATGEDLPFYQELFDACADPSLGLIPFDQSWEKFFMGECSPVITGHKHGSEEEIHLFMIYHGDIPIGIMTNRRDRSSGRERLGILIKKDYRACGIGGPFITFMAQWRYREGAIHVGAVSAKINHGCLKMLDKAGAIYLGESLETVGHLQVPCQEYQLLC